MIYVYSALFVLVLLVAVLLNINITLKVHYDKDNNLFRCTAHYLFLKFVLAPEEEKKKKKKAEKESTPKKKEKKSFAEKIEDEGIGEFIDDLKDTIKGVWKLVVSILKRSYLKSMKLHFVVAGEDPAETAVLFGYANGVVHPVVTALVENVRKYKDLDVNVAPDFSDDPQADFQFDAQLNVKPARLLGAALENREDLADLLKAINK